MSAILFSLLTCTSSWAVSEFSSPYGIHAHLTRGDEYSYTRDELKLYNQANIGWLRTGFVWSQINRKKGEWDFAKHDSVVDQCEKSGVKIMGLLHGAPQWAEPVIENLDTWREFVRTTVTRYKGRVPAWQMWNEPNLESFWKSPNPEHYAALLKVSYEEIRKADPKAIVVWGATSQLDWEFLKVALPLSDGKFDVMSVHPYGYGSPRAPEAYIADSLYDLRKLLKITGIGERPIWFTEWGWPTHTGRRGMRDREQGQYIARAYICALQAGLERGFWYEFQERAEGDEVNEDAFGIVEYNLKPKPAYYAYRTLIKASPAGSIAIEKTAKEGLIYYPAWKRPDGVTVHAVWIIWNRWANPRQTPVTFKRELQEAYDYLDKPMKLKKDASGKTILPLDWGNPIYLIGPETIIFE